MSFQNALNMGKQHNSTKQYHCQSEKLYRENSLRRCSTVHGWP